MFFKKEVNKSNATKQMRTEKTGSKETHGGRGGKKRVFESKERSLKVDRNWLLTQTLGWNLHVRRLEPERKE